MVTDTQERILVNLDDAAAMISVSRRTLERMIDNGDVPVLRLGRSVRVPVVGLRQYLDRLAQAQT